MHPTCVWDLHKQTSARRFVQQGRWEFALLDAGLIVDQQLRETMLAEIQQHRQTSRSANQASTPVSKTSFEERIRRAGHLQIQHTP